MIMPMIITNTTFIDFYCFDTFRHKHQPLSVRPLQRMENP